ncbi:hypothetical protein NIES2100_27740 [Calothrix sp. NIES-2100]|uniref:hypothetical protein n=1 Tax=Calothrix sp. NIES-2100 TaxID=1954172 RepID=UPI000B5FE6FD|nr:hypothetical protein NIES2100_27740 [Calothrix sp. NIES-2100]
MKQQQVIMGSITATVSAIALGYLGVQYLNQTAMYTVAGAMLGLGATTQVTQLKSKSHVRRSQLLLLPASSVITVSEEPPQPIQLISQSIEPHLEHHVEVIESDYSKELITENDPIIERFLKLGLEDF